MTSEAPATALAAAMAAVADRDTWNLAGGFDLRNFVREHGPALAAALVDARRYRYVRDVGTDFGVQGRWAPNGEWGYMEGAQLDAAIDAALSARVDDTPTRGTP